MKIVEDEHPAPHAKYLVWRKGIGPFVATPCYGMHAPWWVPWIVESEGRNWGKTIDMEDSDLWRPWSKDESPSLEA